MVDPTDILGLKNIFKPRKPHISTIVHADTGVSDLPIASRITKADDTKPLTSAENLAQHYKKGYTEKRIADRTAASKNKFNNDFIARTIEAMKKPQIRNRWNPDIQNKYFHLADDWKKISNKDTFADRSYVLSKLLEYDSKLARSAAANLDKSVRSKQSVI